MVVQNAAARPVIVDAFIMSRRYCYLSEAVSEFCRTTGGLELSVWSATIRITPQSKPMTQEITIAFNSRQPLGPEGRQVA